MPQETQSDRIEQTTDVQGDLLIGLGLGAGYAALGAPALWQSARSLDAILPTVLLATVLVLLSVIDIRHFRLPDTLTLPLAAADGRRRAS